LRVPLLAFIRGSDIVVGCVAWITSRDVLEALASRRVALVVQKETWWKKADARGAALAKRYAALNGGIPAVAFPDSLAPLGVKGPPAIACVGYGGGSNFMLLMHHKFVVRCEIVDPRLWPIAVWTGSFNFSANANDSFENAVEIHDPGIAAAYLAEFALVASLAETMNWRFTKPSPTGVAGNFVAPPIKTTTRVVKKRTSGKPAKRTAIRKPAAKKTPWRPRAPRNQPPRRRRRSTVNSRSTAVRKLPTKKAPAKRAPRSTRTKAA
jgi:phosphatidylserine/phosphatidylglycerophosphate/cardiolipin synthase-like enzyme